MAESKLDNIEKVEDGYLFTDEQVVELANYIEELRTENDELQAELDQAMEELDKSYEDEGVFDMRKFDDYLTGAGIASLLILLATGK